MSNSEDIPNPSAADLDFVLGGIVVATILISPNRTPPNPSDDEIDVAVQKVSSATFRARLLPSNWDDEWDRAYGGVASQRDIDHMSSYEPVTAHRPEPDPLPSEYTEPGGDRAEFIRYQKATSAKPLGLP